MRRRLKAKKVIPIGILAVCLFMIYKIIWLDAHIERERAVICMEGTEEFEIKIKKENCIVIPDCRDMLTDYDSENRPSYTSIAKMNWWKKIYGLGSRLY